MLASDISGLKTQFIRLLRDYQGASERYDPVSFLNLTHALRLWLEIGAKMDPDATVYRYANIPRDIKAVVRDASYVFLFLPDPISLPTRELVAGPWDGEDISTSMLCKLENNSRTSFTAYLHVQRDLDDAERRQEERGMQHVPLGRAKGFQQYMNRPIIFFRFPGCRQRSISCEELIRRTANEYGGSHEKTDDAERAYSSAVRAIMEFRIGDLPVPYVAALHIAKTIIQSVETSQFARQ